MPPTDREKDTEVQKDPLDAHGLLRRAAPLVVWREGGQEREFTMTTSKVVLGSREGVDLQVRDPNVSRLHAELELRGQELWITDLGSTNGTFIGDIRVTGARLVDRSVVRVGATELTVHLSSPPVAVELWPANEFHGVVGRSSRMRELFALLDRVAKLPDPVLIEGETGTGKDLIARAIHAASPRHGGPFMVVDCGAVVESVLEAELFGHAQGAFTDAHVDREGSVEAAHGGTVFLDEIGELPLELQPKLLRVLEARAVRRLGETHYREVDVRFVCATHQNLRERVNAGTFREDLYFRLAVFPVTVPPLRERPDDIPLLAARLAPAMLAPSPQVLTDLAARPWRGNVRELRNFLQRASALGVDHALDSLPRGEGSSAPSLFGPARDEAIAAFERTFVARVVAAHDGNVADAAEAAGVSVGYLYKLMRRHGISE